MNQGHMYWSIFRYNRPLDTKKNSTDDDDDEYEIILLAHFQVCDGYMMIEENFELSIVGYYYYYYYY